MYRNIPIQFLLILMATVVRAQFAPAAGSPGSTAIFRDSSIFLQWAKQCVIQRGYMDVAVPDSGYASVGDGNSAVGKAGQNGVVSLGDGGIATLTFQYLIYNGPGFDFAVFENGFYTSGSLAFLEFAFVEVSSDGTNFFRFPATSNVQDTSQIPMTGVDCSLVNNLAGKYVSGFGTPFDLEELKTEMGLDVNNITHVRVIDVVGSIDSAYASRDQFGKKVNDPYPTLFPSSGFDLDAVGAIHAVGLTSVGAEKSNEPSFMVYPNPCSQYQVRIHANREWIGARLSFTNSLGKILRNEMLTSETMMLNATDFSAGIYFLTLESTYQKRTIKLIIQ